MIKRRVSVFCLVFAALFSGGLVFGQSALMDAFSGEVQVMASAGGDWRRVESVPLQLAPGSRVRTGPGEYARIVFQDGSRVLVNAGSDFSVTAAEPMNIVVELKAGDLVARVRKILARKFIVNTPPAVCAVRGTYFQVSVAGDGQTKVQLFEGLLHIADRKGGETLLRPDEMIEIGRELGTPRPIPPSSPAGDKGAGQNRPKGREKGAGPADFRDSVNEKSKAAPGAVRKSDWEDFRGKGVFSDRDHLIREMHSDLRKESRQRLEIQETRTEQHQDGRVSMDENGNRLRHEDMKLPGGQTLIIEKGNSGNSSKTYDLPPPGQPAQPGNSGGGNSGNGADKPVRPDKGNGKGGH